MAIKLITGQPGHGKTLYAIWLGLQLKAEGREVYADGIKGLDYDKTGFKPLPHKFTEWDAADKDDQGRQMPKWQLLPHGSVIILDECYDYMPQRAAGAKVPAHIDALARHRHHGYDIILLCQKHDQLDSFVKGLIDPHIHVRRKFGFNVAILKTWDRFESNVAKGTDYLVAPTWRYPKEVYSLYTSATMHTVKKKLPWYFFAPFVLVPLVVGAVWYTMHSLRAMGDRTAGAVATDGRAPTTVAPGQTHSKSADDDLRQRDYAAWIKPRVKGMPWTAPAYDQLQPQGVPDLFCIAVDDGRCSCHTEQGTKYEVEANVCRAIARDGVYNPFRKPLERNAPRSEGRGGQSRADVAAKDQQPATVDGGAGGYWPKPTIPQDYSPPEHQIATGMN